MESRAKLFGHPIHQMLIVFPLGLLAMAVIFDVIHLASGNSYWSEIAFWMMAAGIVSGLFAAPFGLIGALARWRARLWPEPAPTPPAPLPLRRPQLRAVNREDRRTYTVESVLERAQRAPEDPRQTPSSERAGQSSR